MSKEGSTAGGTAPGAGMAALPIAGCSMGLKGLGDAGEPAVAGGPSGAPVEGDAGTLAVGGRMEAAFGGGEATATPQIDARTAPLNKR